MTLGGLLLVALVSSAFIKDPNGTTAALAGSNPLPTKHYIRSDHIFI